MFTCKMNMCYIILTFVLLIKYSAGALAIYPVRVGERLMLDLGPNIKTWGRTRGGANEFIKYCGPTEKNIRCTQFVLENGSATTPNAHAQVAENGTLIIDPFLASDVGEYFSPDELERINHNADGSYWATPRTRISVILQT